MKTVSRIPQIVWLNWKKMEPVKAIKIETNTFKTFAGRQSFKDICDLTYKIKKLESTK